MTDSDGRTCRSSPVGIRVIRKLAAAKVRQARATGLSLTGREAC